MGWLHELLQRVLPGAGRKSASFRLELDAKPAITVGHLTYDDGVWSFFYDDAFKQHKDLRPLDGFPDIDRVYRSQLLFPFFAVRIPDRGRADVEARLAKEAIAEPDAVDLLRIFGRRIVSSPGLLLLADDHDSRAVLAR
jgi:HipA-like protein